MSGEQTRRDERADAWQAKLDSDPAFRHEWRMRNDPDYFLDHMLRTSPRYQTMHGFVDRPPTFAERAEVVAREREKAKRVSPTPEEQLEDELWALEQHARQQRPIEEEREREAEARKAADAEALRRDREAALAEIRQRALREREAVPTS